MKVGVLVNNFCGFPETGRSTRACVDLALHAERLGFDSVWVTDHIVLPRVIRAPYPHHASGFPYSWQQDIHEPIVLMSALAQATERVEIGVSVLVIPYRHPLLTAKMLATVDQLSEGRIVLGAGVGWLREEFEALDLPPSIFEHRGGVTVDYVKAMQTAWSAEDTVDYEGSWVRFEDLGMRPRPARRPRIPVWMGGAGDRVLRRSVAIAEGYLAIATDAQGLAADRRRLDELAREAGRDPASLSVASIDGIVLDPGAAMASGASLQGDRDEILVGLRGLADAGLDHLVAGISLAGDRSFAASVEALERVASEILPAARDL